MSVLSVLYTGMCEYVCALQGELFQEHTGRVFRLQFDEFQIVSSSHDDTILVWNFLDCGASPDAQPARDRDRPFYD